MFITITNLLSVVVGFLGMFDDALLSYIGFKAGPV